MIGHLHGRVAASEGGLLVLVTPGGVGYEVHCTRATSATLHVGDDASLSVHTQVLKAEIRLFGFVETGQRDLFRLLIGVNQVGSQAALRLLDEHGTVDLQSAIAAGDVAALARTAGIGPKRAERIVLELTGRFHSDAPRAAVDEADEGAIGEAVGVLVGLGYTKTTATAAVIAVATVGQGAHTLVSAALRHLEPAA